MIMKKIKKVIQKVAEKVKPKKKAPDKPTDMSKAKLTNEPTKEDSNTPDTNKQLKAGDTITLHLKGTIDTSATILGINGNGSLDIRSNGKQHNDVWDNTAPDHNPDIYYTL